MPALGLSQPEAYVVVTTVTAVVWSLLTLGIRVFLRLKVNGPFGLDDAACGATTFVGVVHSTLTLYQIRLGLGQHADELSVSAVIELRLWSWINNLLFILALAVSMLSVCFLIARIIGRQRKVWVAYGIAIATGLWAAVSIFFFAFMCTLPRPWLARPAHCINRWALYAAVDAVKVALELANIIAAGMLCWTLQMPLRARIQVVAIFALRLLIIPPSLVRLRYTHIALFSNDWSRARVGVVIITQIVLHVSIMLATIPCAKPFLVVFDSGGLHMPAGVGNSQTPLVRPQPPPPADSNSTSSLAKLPGLAGRRKRREAWRVVLRPDSAKTVTTVTTVQHDADQAKIAARMRSIDSSLSSRNGIVRTDSVAIAFDDAAQMLNQKRSRSIGELANWRLPEL